MLVAWQNGKEGENAALFCSLSTLLFKQTSGRFQHLLGWRKEPARKIHDKKYLRAAAAALRFTVSTVVPFV